MGSMQKTWLRTGALTALALMASACSADLSLNNFIGPKPETVAGMPNWTNNAYGLRPITSADLVRPDGQCGAAPGAQGYPQGAPGSVPLVAGAISLQMTECDVVGRAGPVEKMDLGANPRGERTLVLTYLQGPWPGIYRFSSGRLVAIERAPAPPAPDKPQRPGAKKPAGS
jgi:hypothetical protein